MAGTVAAALTHSIEQAVAKLDRAYIKKQYWEQNEFIAIPEFLPRALVDEHFVPATQSLKPRLNRSYIPGHKKGGSVSSFLIRREAPAFMTLYYHPGFQEFLGELTGATLLPCPENDPHACALYYYTEPEDYIGFHYDKSYYKGARYTILLGVVDDAPSCRLICQLYKDDPSRYTEERSLATAPGTIVIFNGEKLWHAVTPLGPDEERIVLTLEYVTDPEMTALNRFCSNIKDAFGYFGLKTLWDVRTRKSRRET